MADETTYRKTETTGGTHEDNVTYLDQALWRQLREPEGQLEFYNAWLALQLKMIEGVSLGVILLREPGKSTLKTAAVWPQNTDPRKLFAAVFDRVIESGKGVVTRSDLERGEEKEEPLHIGYPVKIGGKLVGAAAFEVTPRSKEKLQVAMRHIQWGLAWVENRLLLDQAGRTVNDRSRISNALDLTAVTLQEESFKASANSLVTELAARLDCDRVSLGFKPRRHVKLAALSHAAQFKKQMNLVRAIETAMNESMDQVEPVVHPEAAGAKAPPVKRAHEELVSLTGAGAVCTVPFIDSQGGTYGALTLERSADKPFTLEEVELVDVLASLLGPILEEKRQNSLWLIARAAASMKIGLGKVLGPGHLAVKTLCLLGAVATLFFAIAEGQYRVTAKTTIEGAVQRAIVVPFDGFLSEASVRAGDTVTKGQALCSLDDRDMHLERLRWSSQREQYQRQYREAMAEGNRANVKILREQINQAEAQISLLDEQLDRARLRAPFDGIVISGDQSQALGSPVQRGQVLFEIAPLKGYRLKLRIQEKEINTIDPGQKGTLVLNALPEEPLPINVRKITPVSAAEEGRNFFLVEAGFDRTVPGLRPGMEGYSKVIVGKRKLFWIWTHALYDWFRLWVWSWWP